VGEFGRETDVVRHDRVDARFVGTVGGGGGEHDFESGLGEERVPEGIVLVHVEYARYSDTSPAARRAGPVEEQRVLLGRYVASPRRPGTAVGEDLFAFVAGVVGVIAREGIFRDEATVLAASARDAAGGIFRRTEQVVEARGGFAVRCRAGVQGAAVGSHQLRHVAARDFRAGQQF